MAKLASRPNVLVSASYDWLRPRSGPSGLGLDAKILTRRHIIGLVLDHLASFNITDSGTLNSNSNLNNAGRYRSVQQGRLHKGGNGARCTMAKNGGNFFVNNDAFAIMKKFIRHAGSTIQYNTRQYKVIQYIQKS